MRPKLINEEGSEVFSPLIDVVFNALAAMFIIFVVYVTVFQSSGSDPKLPVDLLAGDEVRGVYQKVFVYNFPSQYGSWPRSYEIVEGRLPDGLQLYPEKGLLLGIPRALPGSPASQEQTYRIRVRVADGSSSDEESYSFVFQGGWIPYSPEMDAVAISRADSLLPPAQIGIPYEEILGVQGGLGPFNWTLESGSLPRGLVIRDGKILGAPQDAAGVYYFSVKLEDNTTWFASERGDSLIANYQEAVKNFKLTLNPAPGNLQAFLFLPDEIRQGAPIEGGLLVNTGLFDNEAIAEQVPEGLRFDAATGSLSGAIRDTGQFSLAIRVKGPLGVERTASRNFRVLPPKAPFSVSPASFFIRAGQPADLSVPYRGAVDPVSWQLQGANGLPQGLAFGNGRITGQTSVTGQFQMTVTGVDAAGSRSSARIEVNVRGGQGPLEVVTTSIPDAIVGTSYNFAFSARGADGNYTWRIDGKLPEGLNFDNGRISGVAREPASAPIRATVTSGSPEESRTGSFELKAIYAEVKAPEITTTALPPAIQGEPYQIMLAAEGGVGRYRWELSGSLPAGLSFTAGAIQGAVIQSNRDSTWLITARVTDEAGQSDERSSIGLRVLPPGGGDPLEILTGLLPQGVVRSTYRAQIIAAGGTPPYTFALQETSLEGTGLALTAEGFLEGVPSIPGRQEINVAVTDQSGKSGALKRLELVIGQAPGKVGAGFAVVAVMGVLLFLVLVAGLAFFLWRRPQKNSVNSEKES